MQQEDDWRTLWPRFAIEDLYAIDCRGAVMGHGYRGNGAVQGRIMFGVRCGHDDLSLVDYET
ncbi:MAG: hypothetical protein WDN49_10470 [Acetobacteraceae bacterium]